MKPHFHPSARNNFDGKAAELAGLVVKLPEAAPYTPSFPSELHIAAHITPQDIIGELDSGHTDYKGRFVSRYFMYEESRCGLEGTSYERLISLAEQIYGHQRISENVSLGSLEKWIFEWLKARFKGDPLKPSVCDYIAEIADQEIRPVTAWVPIDFLEVACTFRVGAVAVQPITSDMVDEWVGRLPASSDDEKKKVEWLKDWLKKEFQGLASVVLRTDAEPKRAKERSIEQANDVISILGMYSIGALFPDIRCPCRVKGDKALLSTSVILDFGGQRFVIDKSLLDPSFRYWRVGQRDIEGFRIRGLEILSDLLVAANPSDFAQRTLAAIRIYSRCAFTSEPMEKLVYVFAAIESMLVRNESEPIQQNIGDRLALLIGKSLDERKHIIQLTKSVYAMRSRFVHHGKIHSENQTMGKFLRHVATFFDLLLRYQDRFTSKEDFLAAIEDRKLSY